MVVDHHDELYERVARHLPVDKVLENRYDRGLSGARNTGLERPAARSSCSSTTMRCRRGLVGAPPRPLCATCGDRRRWAGRAELVECATLLVPGRVRLGGGLLVRGVAGPAGDRPQPDRCQHVVPSQAPGGGGRVRHDGGPCRYPACRLRGDRGCDPVVPAASRGHDHARAPVVVHHLVPPERARWRYFRQRCWSEGLSKAEVARLAGPRRALQSENQYVTRTIPRWRGPRHPHDCATSRFRWARSCRCLPRRRGGHGKRLRVRPAPLGGLGARAPDDDLTDFRHRERHHHDIHRHLDVPRHA